jgi:alpha-glucosidase
MATLLSLARCRARPVWIALGALIVCVAAPLKAQSVATSIVSPDGQLAIEFRTELAHQPAPVGQLVYAVTFHGKPVITASTMALDLRSEKPLGANVRIVDEKKSSGTDQYRLIAGKAAEVNDRYSALTLEVAEPGEAGRKLTIEARAYDAAVAFRYVVPEQPALKSFQLAQEKTEFRLPNDAMTWALELPNYRSMYESEFVKLPATAFSNQGGVKSSVLIGLPLLMELPGTAWLAITEADLRDYAKMYLTNPSGAWTGFWFESRLAPQVEQPDIAVTGTLPHRSPWRIVMVADEPGRFIESNVLTSLNPPSALADTSWIRAGKASWDWWSGSLGADGKGAFTTATMKYYVDFAADSKFEYMLIDAGWSVRGTNPDVTKLNGRVDVPEVVRYAKSKNVRVWLWAGYADLNRQMDEAFATFEQWGIAGVKTDFIERDDQAGIAFYYRAAESAARHHLMMDFHGATAPWGLQRTWPNVLGYEAVLGMEQSKAGSRDNPDHHVTLPFTRMLGGLMDYTPGGFDNVTRAQFVPRMSHPMVMGTRAHQLAMYVVFEAPSQMVSDHPGAYAGVPAFQFIKDVPATWDETHALGGRPDEFVAIARRRGETWFLGVMTNWTARQLAFPLTFLGEGRYIAEIYADATDADVAPKNVAIEKRSVDRTMKLEARLAPGGGYAVRFVPIK